MKRSLQIALILLLLALNLLIGWHWWNAPRRTGAQEQKIYEAINTAEQWSEKQMLKNVLLAARIRTMAYDKGNRPSDRELVSRMDKMRSLIKAQRDSLKPGMSSLHRSHSKLTEQLHTFFDDPGYYRVPDLDPGLVFNGLQPHDSILLTQYRMWLLNTEYKLLEKFAEMLGTADISFESIQGMMASRGSRSQAVEVLDTAAFMTDVVENEFIETGVLPYAYVYPNSSGGSFTELLEAAIAGRKADPVRIQIHELVNHFDYNINDSLYTELNACPWNPGHLLLLISVNNTLEEDVSNLNIEVRFNENAVAAYRHLGQEGIYFSGMEPLAASVFEPGKGEVILFEIVPKQMNGNAGVVKMDNSSSKVNMMANQVILFGSTETTEHFRLAAALAELALVLKDSKYKAGSDIGRVKEVLEELDKAGSYPLEEVRAIVNTYSEQLEAVLE